jgi:tol-pal system protein YbgF
MMKRFFLFLFLFLVFFSLKITANTDNIDSNNDKITQEKNHLEVQVAELRIKIESMECDIQNLSVQIKNMEANHSNNSAIVNVQKSPLQKNYDEEKQDYDLALLALKDSDYKIAEQRFKKFIDDYHDSSLLSNIYFWYGELYFRQGDFENAGIYFLKGYRKFPLGIKSADSLLKLALSLDKLNKPKETCKIIEKLQKEFKERSLSSNQKEKEIIEKNNCQK